MLKQTEAAGIRIAYQETGSGRPLILMHGVGAAQEIWDKNRAELSRHFRVITPDLPGCGRSGKPLFFDYSFLNLARVMREFVLQFAAGGEKPAVGGNSMGGGLALVMVPEIQDRLSHLVLIGSICYPQPIPWGFELVRKPLLGELAMFLAPAKKMARLVLGEALFDKSLGTPDWVNVFARPIRSPLWRRAQIGTIRGIIPPNTAAVTSRFKNVRLPTLIVWGKEDLITPPFLVEQLKLDIPHASVRLIERCGHIPQFENPAEVSSAMLDFLGK